MHSKKTYPDTLDAQVEYLKEKLNKNTTKALVKLNKKMGVDLGRSSTKDMWLTACCKKLVTLEGQSLVHKILPKTIIEQLFESFPPPLVKAKFAEEIKNSKSVVTIDDEADTEGSVKEVPNCVRQSSHGSLKQSSLKNDSGFDMKKRTKECNPYENEWVKIIEDLRYEEIDSNPKNPYP